jgi:signal peptidase I
MRSIVRFLVWLLLLVGAVIGVARATAIEWWRVPVDDAWLGASVAPSLRPGDWVILWRLTQPSVGDLVKCPEPNAPERIVIGRILGNASDELEFTDRGVIRNGGLLTSDGRCDEFDVAHPRTAEPVHEVCSVEKLNGYAATRYPVGGQPQEAVGKRKFVVPEGNLFLVSDNRMLPFDSRDYGPVSASSCRQTVVFLLWGQGGYFDHTRRFSFIR